MPKIVLQPAGGKIAQVHYQHTIENLVPISRIEHILGEEEITTLTELYPEGKVAIWGATLGRSQKEWEKIDPYDVVLFSGNKKFFATGIVPYKFHNPPLAEILWGHDADGKTWEYVYFLKDITKLDVPYEEVRKILGSNSLFRNLQVLTTDASEKLFAALSIVPVTESDFRAAVKKLEWRGDLDKSREVYSRMEQAFLRWILLGSKQHGTCVICGCQLPTDLLVAAHIKRRSDCSKAEKLDFKNNVMPVCKLGCDELFERGYITVLDGRVVKNSSREGKMTEKVKVYVNAINDRPCPSWQEDSPSYFDWHRKYHGME